MDVSALSFLRPDWPAPPNVRAVTTTRREGSSVGAYASLNLGMHVGDAPTAVAANRARLREALALPCEPRWLQQVHGADVVNAAAAVNDAVADGAYTNQANVVCAILTADCLPVFLCDRDGTEVGLLHAGWRGLAAGVITAGLQALRAPPERLLAWLGPAIGPRVYEVGEDVRNAFLGRNASAVSAFTPGRVPGKWYLDVYQIAREQLQAAGVSSVYGGGYCTVSQPELFFSHRRDGVTGRMASLIWLHEGAGAGIRSSAVLATNKL